MDVRILDLPKELLTGWLTQGRETLAVRKLRARLCKIRPALALRIRAIPKDFLTFWLPQGRETLALRKLRPRLCEIAPAQPGSQNPCFS